MNEVAEAEHNDVNSNTRARLSNILQSFSSFDADMKIGTRQRREKDEQRIAKLTQELAHMEKTLSVEITRRIELNKSMQSWAETEIDNFTQSFKEMVIQRSEAIQDRLADLSSKIDRVQEHFTTEMAKVPIDIERQTHDLTTMLVDFEAKFEQERTGRLEREGRILKQLVDHEQVVEKKFEEESSAREATTADIRRVLDENIRSRMKGDERFQTFVAEELAGLRNCVEEEKQTREREDDEIVDALDRYVNKLKTSLKIISAD